MNKTGLKGTSSGERGVGSYGSALSSLSHSLTGRSLADILLPERDISVSIEKERVSIASVVRSFSRTKVEWVRSFPFEGKGYPDPGTVRDRVSGAMDEMGEREKRCYLSIPKLWVLAKKVDFPSSVKENLHMALSYELDRLTPFDHEEALYDIKALEEGEGRIEALIFAVKADVVEKYLQALKEVGVVVEGVTLNPVGAASLFLAGDREEDFLFLNTGGESYEGVVCSGGQILNTFSGEFDPSEDEAERLGKLVADLRPVEELDGRGGRIVSIKVMGDDGPLREQLKGRFEGIDIVPVEEEMEVLFPPMPGTREERSPCAIGSALGFRSPEMVNLLSKGKKEKKGGALGFTAAILLAMCALWLYLSFAPGKVESRKLSILDSYLAERKPAVEQALKLEEKARSLEEELGAIDRFRFSRPSSLILIREVTSSLPGGAWVNRLVIKEGKVQIYGYADSSSGLLSRLEASPYLKEVGFISPTSRDRMTGKERFAIRIDYEKVGEQEK